MKRYNKAIILISIFLVALVASCSPIPKPEKIDKLPLTINPANITTPEIMDTYFTVEFLPVMNATGYTVKATSNDGMSITQPIDIVRDWNNGRFSTTVYGAKPETEYTITLIAKDSNNNETEKNALSKIKTRKALSIIEMIQPTAWLKGISTPATDTFNATITIDQKASTNYKISILKNKNVEEEITFFDGEIQSIVGEVDYTIKDLTKESMIIVEHGNIGNDGNVYWSKLKTNITFPKNITMYKESFKLNLNKDNGVLSWEGANGNQVALYSFKNENLVLETTLEGNNGSGDSSSWQNPYSLDSRLYFVTDGKNISNPVFMTTGPIVSVKKDQQNIILSWTEPEGFAITYSGISKPTKVGNTVTVEMRDLESLTEYEISINVHFADGRDTKKNIKVTTDSFEGRYRWVDKPGLDKKKSAGNFIVNVVKADPKSNFKYYVYTDLTDQKCIDDNETKYYRLSPLVDKDVDEVAPTDFINFNDTTLPAANAYRWNENKWNGSRMKPQKWKIDSVQVVGDKTSTIVRTSALGLELTTETVMDFKLSPEGKPILTFGNKGIGNGAAFINPNLKKNNNIRPSLGEDEYTYVLERIGDAVAIPEEAK